MNSSEIENALKKCFQPDDKFEMPYIMRGSQKRYASLKALSQFKEWLTISPSKHGFFAKPVFCLLSRYALKWDKTTLLFLTTKKSKLAG